MRSTTRLLFALALGLAALAPARGTAQTGYLSYRGEGTLFGLAWQPSVALRELRSTYARQSVRGAELHLHTGIGIPAAVGVSFAWNDFGVGLASGQTAGLTTYTLLGTAHWYLGSEWLQPYVAIRAGGARRNWRGGGGSDYGVVVDPALGVLWTFDQGAAIDLAIHYHFEPTRFVSGTNESGALIRSYPQWAGLQVGLSLY